MTNSIADASSLSRGCSFSSSIDAASAPQVYVTEPTSMPVGSWEAFRSKLAAKRTLNFIPTLILMLAATLLASFSALQGNWIICGISLGIIVLSLILTLLLAIPLRNKLTGTQLIDEISQDISSIGSGFVNRYGLMFSTIKSIHIPELLTQKSEEEKITSQIEEKKHSIQQLEVKIAASQHKLEEKRKKSKIFPKSLKYTNKKPCN
ncbi:hypothetical protein C10C_0406 [Chlamydia serpentis]|uniref:Uncharacterized protein n=1 Tax=Chlamydia serpentis TaxID=1967782 RepID=A0A2R8FAX4_9CHLA|nr:hypothetical protein C10C_0406 [Chlamydia serpentis]